VHRESAPKANLPNFQYTRKEPSNKIHAIPPSEQNVEPAGIVVIQFNIPGAIISRDLPFRAPLRHSLRAPGHQRMHVTQSDLRQKNSPSSEIPEGE
jgi:hypothetical protein